VRSKAPARTSGQGWLLRRLFAATLAAGSLSAVSAPAQVALKPDTPNLLFWSPDQQARWYHQCKREWQASRAEGRAFVNPVKDSVLRWRT
jgi:hypothetical protein